MYQTLKCISLRTVKYDDRHTIVTAWSVERGRVSLLVSAGGTREARRRRALMMPLSVFEGVVDMRPGRELHSIRDVRAAYVSTDIAGEPTKAVMAMFLSEVLERVLRTDAPDEALSAYILESIKTLDRMPAGVGVANFPLVFLYKLGLFLGIRPDAGEWTAGSIFDMRDGVYRATAPGHSDYLDAAGARLAAMLDRLDYRTATRLHMPRQVRREALTWILRYYTAHHARLDDLRSWPVVREVFS